MLHKDPMLPKEATLPTLPNEVVGQPQGDAVPDAIPAAFKRLFSIDGSYRSASGLRTRRALEASKLQIITKIAGISRKKKPLTGQALRRHMFCDQEGNSNTGGDQQQEEDILHSIVHQVS